MNTVQAFAVAAAVTLSVAAAGTVAVYHLYTPVDVTVEVDVNEEEMATVLADRLISAENNRLASAQAAQHARHCRLWDTGVTPMPGC